MAAAVAGMMLDPERLLWVPGQKTIFLPAKTAFGEGFLAPEWIARETLRWLEQNPATFGSTHNSARVNALVGVGPFTDQTSITVQAPARWMTRDQYSELVLRPAAAAIASRLEGQGPLQFGDLPRQHGLMGPVDVVRVSSPRASIRMIQAPPSPRDWAYDGYREDFNPDPMIRFDVLTGRAN
jgi:hypothetical protein